MTTINNPVKIPYDFILSLPTMKNTIIIILASVSFVFVLMLLVFMIQGNVSVSHNEKPDITLSHNEKRAIAIDYCDNDIETIKLYDSFISMKEQTGAYSQMLNDNPFTDCYSKKYNSL